MSGAPAPGQRLVVRLPQVGTKLISKRGDYEVRRVLGTGEFGAVYDCLGPFDQVYAVKMIRPANRPYAQVYDEWSAPMTDDIPFYVELARAANGPLVELAVGSGRVAIPVAQATGRTVIGIDSSPAMLDQARALVPVLAERAAATNANRDVPPETIADFHCTGILRIIQPRRFGGLQLRFSLFSRIVEILTEGCASSGWVYAVLGEHQWLLASYPEQAQIDIWGDDPRAVASSSLAPRAVAERVAGGWRLSGQYSFSSGSTYAQWAIIGAFLDKPGDPAAIAYLLVPFTDVEIIDDWHVLGLAGTGSRSLRLRDVFVPQHRCVLLSELLAGTPPGAKVHADYPLVRTPRGLVVNYSLPPVAIALGNLP